MPPISRRSFALGGASAAILAAVFPHFAHAEAAVNVEQFRVLSARLTDLRSTELNAAAAAQLLDTLIGLGRGPDLARLAATSGMGAGTLADDIVAAWYSGSFDTASGPASFGLTHALLWHALDFTKPPGLCGNAPAYWAEPPQI